eukprot:1802583-Prymnesium_polylepis.1
MWPRATPYRGSARRPVHRPQADPDARAARRRRGARAGHGCAGAVRLAPAAQGQGAEAREV